MDIERERTRGRESNLRVFFKENFVLSRYCDYKPSSFTFFSLLQSNFWGSFENGCVQSYRKISQTLVSWQ